jgi:MYXO-CTERM domain-containing protein
VGGSAGGLAGNGGAGAASASSGSDSGCGCRLVPEPRPRSSAGLALLGLALLIGFRRWRARRCAPSSLFRRIAGSQEPAAVVPPSPHARTSSSRWRRAPRRVRADSPRSACSSRTPR